MHPRSRVVIPPPAKDGPLRLKIPAGNWRLYAVYRMFTNQELERGGPGGQGLVLDHFNSRSLDLQLNQLEGLLPTIQRFRSTTFLGFAADSLELEDSNWSDDFLAEFQRRRGYDLTAYLPDLWNRFGPRVQRGTPGFPGDCFRADAFSLFQALHRLDAQTRAANHCAVPRNHRGCARGLRGRGRA